MDTLQGSSLVPSPPQKSGMPTSVTWCPHWGGWCGSRSLIIDIWSWWFPKRGLGLAPCACSGDLRGEWHSRAKCSGMPQLKHSDFFLNNCVAEGGVGWAPVLMGSLAGFRLHERNSVQVMSQSLRSISGTLSARAWIPIRCLLASFGVTGGRVEDDRGLSQKLYVYIGIPFVEMFWR